jgi:hypothetical protein
MLARRRHVVTGGELLDDLDVRGQSGSREDSFQQVVTQEGALGNPAFQRGFEGIHIVDALARIRPFPEKVLVHVGDCGCVRVHAARTREDALEQRSVATGR